MKSTRMRDFPLKGDRGCLKNLRKLDISSAMKSTRMRDFHLKGDRGCLKNLRKLDISSAMKSTRMRDFPPRGGVGGFLNIFGTSISSVKADPPKIRKSILAILCSLTSKFLAIFLADSSSIL